MIWLKDVEEVKKTLQKKEQNPEGKKKIKNIKSETRKNQKKEKESEYLDDEEITNIAIPEYYSDRLASEQRAEIEEKK